MKRSRDWMNFSRMPKLARLCCWREGGEVAKLERVAPREFGGDLATLEKMLLDAVEGPHSEWTPQDLEDITRRVREKRGK
jgi:hypothetical protein